MKLENAAIFKNNDIQFILRWWKGYIVTEYQNENILSYVKELADNLGCQVYGEEGEKY